MLLYSAPEQCCTQSGESINSHYFESYRNFPLSYKSHSDNFIITQIYPTQLTPYEYEARSSYFEKVVIDKDQQVTQEFCVVPKKLSQQVLRILFFDDDHRGRLCGSYEELLHIYNSLLGIPFNRILWLLIISLYYIIYCTSLIGGIIGVYSFII